MPLGRPLAEAGGEPVEELGGQRDFGQKHQSLPALPQGLGDRFEIDLRLARSRHALKQRRGERPLGDSGRQILRRPALIGVELRRAEFGVERCGDRRRLERDGLQRAVLDQSVDHARRALGPEAQFGLRDRRLGDGERGKNAGARIRHAPRRLACRSDAEFRRRRLDDLADPDRHAKHHAAGAQRPARDPIDEVAQGSAERRPIADPGDGLEIVAAALSNRPDDAGRAPRSERHADAGARLERQAGRGAIAVGGVDRHGDQDVDDACSRALRRPEAWEACAGLARARRRKASASEESLPLRRSTNARYFVADVAAAAVGTPTSLQAFPTFIAIEGSSGKRSRATDTVSVANFENWRQKRSSWSQ